MTRRDVMEAAAMQIERGSGNVFADIGVSRPDEALAKANLVMTVERILNDRRLTRAKAAATLEVGVRGMFAKADSNASVSRSRRNARARRVPFRIEGVFEQKNRSA